MSKLDSILRIYTDGACKGNPGPGGWGALLDYEGQIKEIKGFSKNTTNNIMELTAVIEALKQLNRSCNIIITTMLIIIPNVVLIVFLINNILFKFN